MIKSHFQQCCKAAVQCGLEFNGVDFQRALFKRKLATEGSETVVYLQFKVDIAKYANKQFFALCYLSPAGGRFDQCRQKLDNDSSRVSIISLGLFMIQMNIFITTYF